MVAGHNGWRLYPGGYRTTIGSVVTSHSDRTAGDPCIYSAITFIRPPVVSMAGMPRKRVKVEGSEPGWAWTFFVILIQTNK